MLADRDELLRENQNLRQENQEMGELLKEYEKGLEATTELIRDHAVPPQLIHSSNLNLVSSIYSYHSDPSRLQSETQL